MNGLCSFDKYGSISRKGAFNFPKEKIIHPPLCYPTLSNSGYFIINDLSFPFKLAIPSPIYPGLIWGEV